MCKILLQSILVSIGLIMVVPVVAIDGDFGSPYAVGQQDEAMQRAPGDLPGYGGKVADIPVLTIIGGILVLAGAGAATYWQVRTARLARPRIAS